jgi:hypothetical protein
LSLPLIDPIDYEDTGIIAKNVSKAEEVKERLLRDLGLSDLELSPVTAEEEEPLLRAIAAGQLDQLWTVEPGGEVIHIGGDDRRELSSGTLVRGAGVVAATPFDLEVPTPRGLQTLHLVTDVSYVNPDWLETLAPHMFEVRPGKIYYDPRLGTLATRTNLEFNGKRLEAAGTPILNHSKENERLFIKLYAAWAHEQLERERDRLQKVNSRHIPKIPLHHVQQQIASRTDNAISLHELSKKQQIELSKMTRLDTYLGDKAMNRLNTTSEGRTNRFWRRRSQGWRPHKPKFNRRKDR